MTVTGNVTIANTLIFNGDISPDIIATIDGNTANRRNLVIIAGNITNALASNTTAGGISLGSGTAVSTDSGNVWIARSGPAVFGSGGANAANGNANSGAMSFGSGAANSVSNGSANSGLINLQTGIATANGNTFTGAITLVVGAATTTGTGVSNVRANSGVINVTGGEARCSNGNATSGNFTLSLGLANATSGAATGGTVIVRSGASRTNTSGAAVSGNIDIQTGLSNGVTSSTQGYINIGSQAANTVIGSPTAINIGQANTPTIIGGNANITGNVNVSANLIANNANIGSGTIDLYANGEINTTGQIICSNSISGTNIVVGAGNTNLYANGDISATGRLSYLRTYGSFTSNATQTSAGANTINYMTLNNTEEANGVSIASNSQITVARTGLYDIQFSAVFTHDTNQIANVEIWLNKNGNVIANTNTIITITKDQKSVAAWDWLVNANSANDYYQIAWASADTNVEIVAVDAGNTIANVAVPSVIVTVTPVGA